MPKSLFLVLLAGIALPVFAANRVAVGQLEQVLTANQGEPDARLAEQLSNMELTERLSTNKLSHWESVLQGPQSRQSLLVLADMSTFLDPPAAEIPATPTPNLATQRHVIALAAAFARMTISKLPDFFATRETTRFEDTPSDFRNSSAIVYQQLHLVNRSRDTVLYRDGREVVDLNAVASKESGRARPGLSTVGVFGPILGTVLVDTARGTLAWSHWEQGAAGPEAIFRYVIPRKESHYEVDLGDEFRDHPGYHGEIAIDPVNGTILRLMVEADMKPDDPVARSGILVDYGPVTIGGKTYICPVKSVSVELGLSASSASGGMNPRLQRRGIVDFDSDAARKHMRTSLNEVTFEQYHVFRAEARVLTANDAGVDGNPPTPATGEMQAAGSVATAENPLEAAAPDSRVQPLSTTASIPAPAPALQPSTPVVAEARPVAPLKSAATPLPTLELPAKQLPTPTFSITSRIVYVDVVVRDHHGHVIHGLSQSDFKISEDGTAQKIDWFQAVSHESSTAPGDSSRSADNLSAGPSNVSSTNTPETVNMILFDLLDTSPTNQTYARSQMLKFLQALPPGHRIALFILTGRELHMVQNFTGNSELLAQAARLLLPKSSTLFQSTDAQRHSNDASASMPGFSTPGGSDNSIIGDLGEELSSENFQHGQARNEIVNQAFQKLAQISARFNGRKNLFWLAESFPLGVLTTLQSFQDSSAGLAGNHATSNAISGARIAVYPISLLGLQSDSIDAEMHGNGSKAGVADLGTEVDQQADAREVLRNQMEDIAAQTGGQAFAGTNDVAGALRQSLEAGENYYSLVYSPSNQKWNGKPRKIHVDVLKKGCTLSYRQGYIAFPEPPAVPGNAQ